MHNPCYMAFHALDIRILAALAKSVGICLNNSPIGIADHTSGGLNLHFKYCVRLGKAMYEEFEKDCHAVLPELWISIVVASTSDISCLHQILKL